MNCLGYHLSECMRLVVRVVELGSLGVLGLRPLEICMGTEELRQMPRKLEKLEKESI